MRAKKNPSKGSAEKTVKAIRRAPKAYTAIDRVFVRFGVEWTLPAR